MSFPSPRVVVLRAEASSLPQAGLGPRAWEASLPTAQDPCASGHLFQDTCDVVLPIPGVPTSTSGCPDEVDRRPARTGLPAFCSSCPLGVPKSSQKNENYKKDLLSGWVLPAEKRKAPIGSLHGTPVGPSRPETCPLTRDVMSRGFTWTR